MVPPGPRSLGSRKNSSRSLSEERAVNMSVFRSDDVLCTIPVMDLLLFTAGL